MHPKTQKIIIGIVIAAIIITTAALSYRSYKKSQCGKPGNEPC